MIGLAGAQRTGKTTLAQAYAEANEVPFLQLSASQVLRDLGVDPKLDYPLKERLAAQEAILESFEKHYRTADHKSITDRTPLDMAAYMLADVSRANSDPETSMRIVGYVQRCLDVTSKYFGIIVVVQPGIPLVEDGKSAPADPAHMEHINQLCMGLMIDRRLRCAHYFLKRETIDLQSRITSLAGCVAQVQAQWEIERNRAAAMGITYH